MKDDIIVGLFFILGAQVPILLMLYIVWSAGFL